jgi:hypothetical protein
MDAHDGSEKRAEPSGCIRLPGPIITGALIPVISAPSKTSVKYWLNSQLY